MLRQIPSSSLGRQKANRTSIHETWKRTAHRAFVTPATSQGPCCHYSWPPARFTSRLDSHAMFKDRLVKRQDRDHGALAMHAATIDSNGATLGQETERPAGPDTTSAGMQQGKLLSMPKPVKDSLIECWALPFGSSQLVANAIGTAFAPKPSHVLREVGLLKTLLAASSSHAFPGVDQRTPESLPIVELLHRWRVAGYRQRSGPGIQQPGSRCILHWHRWGPAPGAEGHADFPPGPAATEGRPGGK